MRYAFIACSATTILAATAMAGDTTRFDVEIRDIDIFYNDIQPGAVTLQTKDPGRYFDSCGWSNVDVDVCWNSPAQYSGWANEVQVTVRVNDGTDTSDYWLGTPFPDIAAGATTPDTCANYQALNDFGIDLPPATYSVDDSGEVLVGMYASWNDTTQQRHSHVNTLDFYFVLAGSFPTGCVDATGDCDEVHATPGCSDLSCCALACDPNAGGDPFCCDSDWDSTCVDLAIGICNIFQYSCLSSAYPNDCATNAITLQNGESRAYSTVNANTDGPVIPCANEGGPNVWYMVEIDTAVDQVITASTCDAATYDTAITIFDAGPIGSTFDPDSLADALMRCNDDGGGCGGYTSRLQYPVATGRQYLLAVAGYGGETGSGTITVSWEDQLPILDPPSCDTPGDTTFTQFVTAPENLDINGGVWCGYNTSNGFCRTYAASTLGGPFEVNCVDFGWRMDGVGYMPAEINLFKSNQQSPVGATLEPIASTFCGLYGPGGVSYNISSVSFDGPVLVDLAEGEWLMIEVNYLRQLWIDGTGYGGLMGCALEDTDGTEGYFHCGGVYTGTMSQTGWPHYQPYMAFNGNPAGGSCTGDFNDDGIVNGADFGSLLAAWGVCGGCPEDLNGDGAVTGADVGLLLSVWGACP
jgi:hypothetical protein